MSTTRSPRPGCFSLDQLESRRLMSAGPSILLNQGTGLLSIVGTDGRDTVHISRGTLNGIIEDSKMVVSIDGKESTLDTGAVQQVQIMTLGGNDSVTIDQGIHFDLRTLDFYVNGGAGNDTITGGSGNDTLSGAGGKDQIDGRDGRDRLNGMDGNDVLLGNKGVDRLFGGAGNDTLDGGKSTDYLYGEGGDDSLNGSDGNDWVDGGANHDIVLGDAGDDTLFGGSGNDMLDGGSGQDTVFGNAGDDQMELKDLEMDLANGGSGVDSAILDDIETAFVIAETKSFA